MVLPKIGNKIPDNRKRNSVKTERDMLQQIYQARILCLWGQPKTKEERKMQLFSRRVRVRVIKDEKDKIFDREQTTKAISRKDADPHQIGEALKDFAARQRERLKRNKKD